MQQGRRFCSSIRSQKIIFGHPNMSQKNIWSPKYIICHLYSLSLDISFGKENDYCLISSCLNPEGGLNNMVALHKDWAMIDHYSEQH